VDKDKITVESRKMRMTMLEDRMSSSYVIISAVSPDKLNQSMFQLQAIHFPVLHFLP